MNLRKFLLLNALLTLFTYSYASETLNPIVVSNSISPIDIHSSPASHGGFHRIRHQRKRIYRSP